MERIEIYRDRRGLLTTAEAVRDLLQDALEASGQQDAPPPRATASKATPG